MELLDLLESRIIELLTQLETIRAENTALKAALAQAEILREESEALRAALAAETALRDEVAGRIDGLVTRLGKELGLSCPEGASADENPVDLQRGDELSESLSVTGTGRPSGISQANFEFLSDESDDDAGDEAGRPSGDARDGTVPA